MTRLHKWTHHSSRHVTEKLIQISVFISRYFFSIHSITYYVLHLTRYFWLALYVYACRFFNVSLTLNGTFSKFTNLMFKIMGLSLRSRFSSVFCISHRYIKWLNRKKMDYLPLIFCLDLYNNMQWQLVFSFYKIQRSFRFFKYF